jgi:hypothetical protein
MLRTFPVLADWSLWPPKVWVPYYHFSAWRAPLLAALAKGSPSHTENWVPLRWRVDVAIAATQYVSIPPRKLRRK